MIFHDCHECGLVIWPGKHGRIIKFGTGFGEDKMRPGVEGWLFMEYRYICQNCSEKFDYDIEWEGVYYKFVTVDKKGKQK